MTEEPKKEETQPVVNKNNNFMTIYMIMALLTFLIICLWYGIYAKYNTGIDDSISSNAPIIDNPIIEPEIISWNSTFNRSDNALQLSFFQLNSYIVIINKSTDVITYKCTLTSEKTCTFTDNDINYNVEIGSNSLNITGYQIGTLTGSFIRTENYDQTMYYQDTINNTNHINSIWNGIYSNETYRIKIYQYDQLQFVVTVLDEGNTIKFKETFTLNNSSLTFNLEEKNINISFINEKLNIQGTSPNTYDIESLISGEYSKESSYIFNDIVADEN